ncbi:MAG: DUF2325 domain-containing protein [Myxococcaceae bacterium]|nr:DUF2325 domain-containing protein [Myxococcaceae bacterium]
MKIGIVGGVERRQGLLERLAERLGHELLFHGGHMTPRGTIALESLVQHCDVVVLVTETNSHAAVQVARRAARARGITPIIVRKLGLSRLTELLSGGAQTSALAGA